MANRSLQRRVEYAAYRGLSAVLLALPEATALRIGEGLGRLAGGVLAARRRVVEENLARAFPEESAEWRRRVAAESWAHLGREAVAMTRLATLEPADILARTDVDGFEALQAALAEGRGAVLVTGHLGSWEIGGAALAARGVPVLAVAKPMANRRFDEDLVSTRVRLGMEVVDTGAAPRRVIRALVEGRAVALVADQNAHADPLFVDFFGTPAATHRGPALFALRTGAPVIAGACLRLPGPVQRYRLWMERVDFEATGDLEEDLRRLTAAHTAVLEAAVREAPGQYFWQHKRWKTRPPDEKAGDVSTLPEQPPEAPV